MITCLPLVVTRIDASTPCISTAALPLGFSYGDCMSCHSTKIYSHKSTDRENRLRSTHFDRTGCMLSSLRGETGLVMCFKKTIVCSYSEDRYQQTTSPLNHRGGDSIACEGCQQGPVFLSIFLFSLCNRRFKCQSGTHVAFVARVRCRQEQAKQAKSESLESIFKEDLYNAPGYAAKIINTCV